MAITKVRHGITEIEMEFESNHALAEFIRELNKTPTETDVQHSNGNSHGNDRKDLRFTTTGKFAPLSGVPQADLAYNTLLSIGHSSTAGEVWTILQSNPDFKTKSDTPVNIVRGLLRNDKRVTKDVDGKWMPVDGFPPLQEP